jgi:hypothetical protein
VVGPKRVKFGVHKGILIRRSAFLRAALTGTFKEATEGTVTLQEDSPKVFGVFVSWLYTGKLENTVDEIPTPYGSNRLAELYIFADRYDVPILRNDAIDALVTTRQNLQIPASFFRKVYDATLPKDPLRRLLADMVVFDTDIRESVVAYRESYPAEMLLDMLVVSSERIDALLSGSGNGRWPWNPTKSNICSSYHTHEEGWTGCKGT